MTDKCARFETYYRSVTVISQLTTNAPCRQHQSHSPWRHCLHRASVPVRHTTFSLSVTKTSSIPPPVPQSLGRQFVRIRRARIITDLSTPSFWCDRITSRPLPTCRPVRLGAARPCFHPSEDLLKPIDSACVTAALKSESAAPEASVREGGRRDSREQRAPRRW